MNGDGSDRNEKERQGPKPTPALLHLGWLGMPLRGHDRYSVMTFDFSATTNMTLFAVAMAPLGETLLLPGF